MQFFRSIVPWNLGLMCIHIWIYCSTHRGLPSGGISLMTVMYIVLSVCLLVMLFFGSLKPIPQAMKGKADIAAAGVMMVSAFLLACPLPLSAIITTSAGAVLGGVGVGWAYARWLELYSQFDIHYAAPLVFLTMAVGSCFKAVVDLCPAYVAVVILVAMPVLAFCALHRSFATVRPTPEPYLYYNERTRDSLIRVAIGIAIFSFVVGIVQATPLAALASSSPVSIVSKHAGEVVVAVALLVWVIYFKRGISFGRTWSIVLVLVATSLMFAPYLEEELAGNLFTFVGVAQTFVIIFLFLALADVARHSTYSPIVVFAAGWIAYALPFALGDLLSTSLQTLVSGSQIATQLVVWVLVVVTLLFFDESSAGRRLIFTELNDEGDEDTSAKRMGRQQEALNEEPAGDPLALRCDALATQAHLTPREREVLEQLARGRSKSYIAEAFFVSENTVRSHVKRLYLKLDVHSKQELVDRVEAVAL